MMNILLVDDDALIRESLKLIFQLDPELTVAGTTGSGRAALRELERFREEGQSVDLVLMDIRMPDGDGVEGTKLVKSAFPNTKVLILTTFDDDDYIVEALKNGADGYMLKNTPPDRIIQGIKTVHQGNMLIHPDIARKLSTFLQPNANASRSKSPDEHLQEQGLTKAEISVVHKIADGLSNREIAQELFLSEGTVKNYISEILGKLSLRDRTQIAIYFLKLQP